MVSTASSGSRGFKPPSFPEVSGSVLITGIRTIDSPFQTIQQGINILVPGDTLLIRGTTAGQTYNESISFSISGNVSQAIMIKGHPNEKVILTGTSKPRFNINRDHWIIGNLIID